MAGLGILNALPNNLRVPISSKSYQPLHSYAISIFQDGGRGIAILLPVFFSCNLAQVERSKSSCVPNFGNISRTRLRYYYFRLLKTNVRHVEILLPVSIFYLCLIIYLPNFIKIGPSARVMTSYTFFKMATTASQLYFRFRVLLFLQLCRSKSTCKPNFGEICQPTAEILLLMVSENRCPPCWNSTSGFDFRLCIKVRWAASNEFCCKFRTLSSSAKIENRLRFAKVTASLKVGTERTSLRCNVYWTHNRAFKQKITITHNLPREEAPDNVTEFSLQMVTVGKRISCTCSTCMLTFVGYEKQYAIRSKI